MTVSFHQLKSMHLMTLGEKLKGTRKDTDEIPPPPLEDIRAFQSSTVGYAITAFFHNMAIQADHDQHGIKDMDEEGKRDYFQSQATLDAALSFFAVLDAWERSHMKGVGDDE